MGPRFVAVDGGELAVWERPGAEPAVLLCHATGSHGRCWDAVTDHLIQRSIAIDMRGHGRSFKPEPPIPWRRFGEDVAEVARALGLRGAIGVGHSMGGHSVALAAVLEPGTFSKLLLLDPAIFPDVYYTGPAMEPHFARKRRNHWNSQEEMFERFRDRAPFNTWDEQVLRDYCEHGLAPAPGGGWQLACPPDIEGSIYEQGPALESDIYLDIERVTIPVTVIRSARPLLDEPGVDMMASPTEPGLAARFPKGRDMVVEGSHFIPMETPEYVAEQILLAARQD